jgi:hypothetical protein
VTPTLVLDPTAEHLSIARQMRAKVRKGWYLGTAETLERYGARRFATARTTPELSIQLLLSRDKMHHSVGWWRNAEYEYCLHLSISARERVGVLAATAAQDADAFNSIPYEDMPHEELRYWARLIFGEHVDKLWIEPGGTDPRLTRDEAHTHRAINHLRLFFDPETFEPFIPSGEVYDLTRWVPGLTPEKVDR